MTGTAPFGPGSRVLVPVPLAGPGDHDAGMDQHFSDWRGWQRYTPGESTSMAVSDCLTARIELFHDARGPEPKWTTAVYASPVGELLWRGFFSPCTPVEVVRVHTDQLAEDLDSFDPTRLHAALHGSTGADPVTRELDQAGWRVEHTPQALRYSTPDGHATVTRWLDRDHRSDPHRVLWELSAGTETAPEHRWWAQFSVGTPTRMITPVIWALTDPDYLASRLYAQVPEPHLGLVTLCPDLSPPAGQAVLPASTTSSHPAAPAVPAQPSPSPPTVSNSCGGPSFPPPGPGSPPAWATAIRDSAALRAASGRPRR